MTKKIGNAPRGSQGSGRVKPFVHIRKMETADLEQVAALEAESFSNPWKQEHFEYYLGKEEALFLVALCNDRIVGYVCTLIAVDEADITNVLTVQDLRRCGIGRKLISALLKQLDACKVGRVFLEVRESNLPAISLYRAFGFTQNGRRKKYYTEPDEDALLMMRSLHADIS